MNKCILIVEDETELSGMLKRYLVKKNYDVTCADTLSNAMIFIQSNRFDAFILDNNLPDGKGLDLIPTIISKQNSPKIIAMSAMQIASEAMKAGASHYVEKPISMAGIYSLLNKAS